MTDRVYPSAKQNGSAAAAATTPAAANPAKPPQVYNPNRIPYRPGPTAYHRHDRRRCNCRRCFCLGCFWVVLIFLILLLLAAIAGGAFYVLYSPKRPTFSVSSLKISQFNLTTTAADDSTRLSAKLNLTISATNPNKKQLIYTYDPISITALSGQISLANGSFPGFVSDPHNITIIHSTLSLSGQVLDADSAKTINSDLKKKRGLPLQISLDTKVVLKLEKLKSKKFGIRVICEGIHSQAPKGKSAAIAVTSDASCKVDLRIKIWKWTF